MRALDTVIILAVLFCIGSLYSLLQQREAVEGVKIFKDGDYPPMESGYDEEGLRELLRGE